MTREQEYAELTAEKRKLAAELKNVQEELDRLEGELLAEWEAKGITSIRVEGEQGERWLLYQLRRVFAKQEFVNLAELPMDLLMFSSQRASAILAEMLGTGDKEGLEHLAQLGILPIERTQIHVKKG